MIREVLSFPETSGDVAAGLRRLADQVEAGNWPDIQFAQALIVNRDASFTCLVFGPASALEATGAMFLALNAVKD